MRHYDVQVYESTFVALSEILFYKVETSQTNSGAIKFRDEIFKAIEELETFPQAGKPLNKNYKAKVVIGHWLVYEIDEEESTVYVSDVIDPQQQTRAGEYY